MPVTMIPIFDVPDFQAELDRGAQTLNDGGVVVLPTETVYGAAARLDRPAGASGQHGS